MKKLMKVVLKLNKTAFTNITMALSIAILSSGCGGATTNNTIEAGGDESSPTDATVLFVDKSSSLQDSVALLAIQTPLLRQVIGATDEPGDAFYGYYIHGNTLSGKHFFSKVLAWEVPNLEGLGGPSRQKRIDAMNSERRKQQGQILKEIKARLQFLVDVGLNYLTLDRSAETLSGGEAQRIRLASQILIQVEKSDGWQTPCWCHSCDVQQECGNRPRAP